MKECENTKLSFVELNDTSAVRRRLISMVDDCFEFTDDEIEKRTKAVFATIKCLYDNGYATCKIDDEIMDEITQDAKDIINGNEENNNKIEFHDPKVFSLYHGSFAIFIMRHLLYANKLPQHILNDSKHWYTLASNYTKVVMDTC